MKDSQNSVLSFSDVSLSLAGNPLVERATFSVREGEFVYLVGKTGTGKSSLLRLIYADLYAQSGHITASGTQVTGINPKEIPALRRKLGIVFQDFQLLPEKNVEENLVFAMKATGWNTEGLIQRRLNELLHELSLTEQKHQYPHQLSGGEQQRVSIARALINNPPLLLADEPTGNLDPEASKMVMAALRNVSGKGTAVLMATHDYELLQQYPGKVLWLKDGHVQEFATSAGFMDNYAS